MKIIIIVRFPPLSYQEGAVKAKTETNGDRMKKRGLVQTIQILPIKLVERRETIEVGYKLVTS